ncbi:MULTISPECIES: GNAT family N-acetyltransferase [Arthrobacter]|uniref:GNAT family N-acetyltransferase n=2 Tax=Arthrobacter TaxID=1663 RepID=A0ABU9KI19_9MICC|nr:GNAT family N-acetyltransferase [Arthrobacter sp. YJM1]MDP5225569.1 GNAT family N-acetyltransferase [Arthrobacter sp. YJM1]
MTVRAARTGDADVLVALRAEMFAAMSHIPGGDAWKKPAREWFRDRIAHPEHGIFVVEVSGLVVACAVASIRDSAPSPAVPQGRDVLITNVCTLPEHRGRGHARAAFEAAMAWARAAGIARAELMATPAGTGMYEKAGFRPTAYPAMRAMLSR